MFKLHSLKKYDTHIVGYYGMLNSGDDALMQASIWGANNILAYKKNSIGAYTKVNDETSIHQQLTLRSTQTFSGQNRLIQYKAAMQSKSIIFGGGSVFHTEKDINFKRHMMKISGNNTSRAVGVSLGPFQSVAAEKACTKFLNECDFMGVRDQQSLDIALDLAPAANVQKTFDLAPLLLCAKPMSLSRNQRSGIALSLCPVAIDSFGRTDIKAEKERVDKFCHLIEALYKTTGEPIILLTFNGHPILGDWKINEAIVNQLNHKVPINIEPYNSNPFSVLENLASYKAIISMRLHGSILGYLANTPVISINYHNKCQGWCQQVGLHHQYQFNSDNFNIYTVTKLIEQGLAYNFIPPKLTISSALKKALTNWSFSYE